MDDDYEKTKNIMMMLFKIGVLAFVLLFWFLTKNEIKNTCEEAYQFKINEINESKNSLWISSGIVTKNGEIAMSFDKFPELKIVSKDSQQVGNTFLKLVLKGDSVCKKANSNLVFHFKSDTLFSTWKILRCD